MNCYKSSFLCSSTVSRHNIKFCLAEKPWSFHVASGHRGSSREASLPQWSAFLQSTFWDMRLVDSRDSMHSINLCYKRKKKNRQKKPPGHVCVCVCMCVCACVAQTCLTFCDPMNCSPAGSSVHGISQASIPKQVVIYFSKGSSRPPGHNTLVTVCLPTLSTGGSLSKQSDRP